MRTPKNFNKMSLTEQESWLVKEYQRIISLENEITRMLAKVRGGYKIKVSEEIARPDEALLKA